MRQVRRQAQAVQREVDEDVEGRSRRRKNLRC